MHHRLDFISGVIDFVNDTKTEEQVLHYGFSILEGTPILPLRFFFLVFLFACLPESKLRGKSSVVDVLLC